MYLTGLIWVHSSILWRVLPFKGWPLPCSIAESHHIDENWPIQHRTGTEQPPEKRPCQPGTEHVLAGHEEAADAGGVGTQRNGCFGAEAVLVQNNTIILN